MLSFADVWTGLGAAYAAKRGPGQLVLDGAAFQVSVHLREEAPENLVVRGKSLNLDADCASVRMVVTLASQIAGSLSAFPNLEALVVEQPSFGARLSLDEAGGALRDVIADARDVQALRGRPLRRLRISGLTDPAHFEFEGLTWLSVTPRASVAQMMRSQESLEVLDLELDVASVRRLSLLGEKPLLRRCSLWWAGVQDLSGIERWDRLADLRLHMVGAESLSPLVDTSVERLVLVCGMRLPTLAVLPRLAHLRSLELTADAAIDTLGDWSASPLKHIELRGARLSATALDGVAKAPDLSHLSINASNSEALARFKAARPDVDIHVWDASAPDMTTKQRGCVDVRSDDSGWFILQDLATALGTATNFEAEELVRDKLGADGALEISFDTESGAFSASATSLFVIENVADAINEIAQGRG